MKWYIGVNSNLKHKAFRAANTPSFQSHGSQYTYVIGPFKTKRAANWVEKYGKNNPHFQHVDDAERLSR